jgi:hypothetical protein
VKDKINLLLPIFCLLSCYYVVSLVPIGVASLPVYRDITGISLPITSLFSNIMLFSFPTGGARWSHLHFGSQTKEPQGTVIFLPPEM